MNDEGGVVRSCAGASASVSRRRESLLAREKLGNKLLSNTIDQRNAPGRTEHRSEKGTNQRTTSPPARINALNLTSANARSSVLRLASPRPLSPSSVASHTPKRHALPRANNLARKSKKVRAISPSGLSLAHLPSSVASLPPRGTKRKAVNAARQNAWGDQTKNNPFRTARPAFASSAFGRVPWHAMPMAAQHEQGPAGTNITFYFHGQRRRRSSAS